MNRYVSAKYDVYRYIAGVIRSWHRLATILLVLYKVGIGCYFVVTKTFIKTAQLTVFKKFATAIGDVGQCIAGVLRSWHRLAILSGVVGWCDCAE